MLNSIFNSSKKDANVNRCVLHMLQHMDYSKYQKFVTDSSKFPDMTHKYVIFEYTESPCDSLIICSERLLPGTPSIHSIISNPLFGDNMRFLFCDNADRVSWYTRRKVDYSLPFAEQLTNVRQLVLMYNGEVPHDDDIPPLMPANNVVLNPDIYNFPDDDDYADMPSLIPMPTNNTVFSNDIYKSTDDVPPPLVPIPSYNYFSNGLNQTIWSRLPYNNFGQVTQ